MTTSATTGTPVAPTEQPGTDQRIVDVFAEAMWGYTPYEISIIVENARLEHASSCVRESGWSPPQHTTTTLALEQPEPVYFGGAVASIRSSLEPEPHPDEPMPDEFWDDWDRCYKAATEAIPDPRSELFGWMDELQDSMTARFHSDPRSLAAEDQFDECILATGHGYTDPNDAANALVEEATRVAQAVQSGEYTSVEGDQLLADLEKSEEQLTSDFVPCFNARAEAVDDIWADIEADVLAEHRDRLVQALLEASTDIESAIPHISDGSP